MEKPVILARLGNPLLHLPQTWGRKVRDECLVIPLSQRLYQDWGATVLAVKCSFGLYSYWLEDIANPFCASS